MVQPILGIDIAKDAFQVTLLLHGKKYHRSFRNQADDFAALLKWLGKHQVQMGHACMEATGRFYESLATFLYEQGFRVSVVNPARIRHYADSKLLRNKTDPLDGDLIADFCLTQQPSAWQPKPAHRRQLQDLVRLEEDLQAIRTQTINRLKSGVSSQSVVERLQANCDYLDQQLQELKAEIQSLIDQHADLQRERELLVSIPGIGVVTAAKLMAESISAFTSTRSLVAYAGLNPQLRLSGSSIRAKPMLSKIGSKTLRKALYLPALSAKRTHPILKEFCERLKQKGKLKMVIVGACMRKLLCLALGVLKSGQPFDPYYHQQEQNMAFAS